MQENKTLSLILPSYNEQDNIERTFHIIKKILDQASIPFEILFVDDGSKDQTYLKIAELAARFPEVRGLSFSRNFGKEAAIFAGLEAAAGGCCLIMDCDMA